MKPLIRAWKLFIYTWALKEIDPLHPDVPHIVQKLNEWERQS